MRLLANPSVDRAVAKLLAKAACSSKSSTVSARPGGIILLTGSISTIARMSQGSERQL